MKTSVSFQVQILGNIAEATSHKHKIKSQGRNLSPQDTLNTFSKFRLCFCRAQKPSWVAEDSSIVLYALWMHKNDHPCPLKTMTTGLKCGRVYRTYEKIFFTTEYGGFRHQQSNYCQDWFGGITKKEILQVGFHGDPMDLCFSGRRVNHDNNMARESGLADQFKHVG